MSYIAAGVAVAGIGTQVVGGIGAAGAASKAARAQQQAAEDFRRYVQKQQDTATGQVLNPSALAAQDVALKSAQANVNRQNALVASLDPNIVEAGKQTAQLLQGKSAPVLAEIQNQRNMQRQQLQAQLTQQMGPGGASSSAGQQALQKFDLNTANMMNSTQQQYLDKVSNISMGGAKTLADSLNSVNTALSDVNSNSPQNKAAQLISQFTNGAGAAAQGAKVNSAGGQYKGQQLLGQMTSQIGGEMVSGAALAAGSQLKGSGADYTQADQDKDINDFADAAGAGGTPAPAGAPLNYAFGGKAPMTLGSSVAAPAMSAGMAGGSGAPSYLPFSTGYGGAGGPAADQAYNMSPRTMPLGSSDFNVQLPTLGQSVVGGGQ